MRLYLKVEAVNIYNTILDTDQLSVIRGSSYLLKQAIEDAKKQLAVVGRFETISEGGSIGIFVFADGLSQEQVKNKVKNVVNQDKYKHFTFVVNTVEAESFVEAKEKLLAKGRAEQVQTLRFPVIKPSSNQTPYGACGLNGLLPAEKEFKGKSDKPLRVSKSVNERYKEGLTTRNELYANEIALLGTEQAQAVLSKFGRTKSSSSPQDDLNEILKDLGVTYDLASLAGHHQNIALDGKIALIYIDGNGFGKAQREIISSATDTETQIDYQQAFDKNLRSKRAEYLLSLMALLKNNGAYFIDHGQQGKPQVLQLETLLWGGDEMTIVVPAWIGIKVLNHFYEFFEDFSLYDCLTPNTDDAPKKTVKHAAGIVFCSAKTPIKKVNNLARKIADDIKELDDGQGRGYNLFDYVVLESIDYPTESCMKDFWCKQYHGLAKKRRPLSFVSNSKNCTNDISIALENLPRASAYKLVEALIDFPDEDLQQSESFSASKERSIFEAYRAWKYDQSTESVTEKPESLVPLRYQRLMQSFNKMSFERSQSEQALFGELNGIFKEYRVEGDKVGLESLTQSDASFWIHLLELYDYLAPEMPNFTDRKEAAS